MGPFVGVGDLTTSPPTRPDLINNTCTSKWKTRYILFKIC